MERISPIFGKASFSILILVNLIPIFGVLIWNWSVSEIVVLYWFENVVIGLVCILKILTATGRDGTNSISEQLENSAMPAYLSNPAAERPRTSLRAKLFLAAFFSFHYGMFCFVHGVFVFMLLDGRVGGFISGGPFALFSRKLSEAMDSGGIWFALAIIGSHLFWFFQNYLAKGKRHQTSAQEQFSSPYGRIVVLHIAILFGAIVITSLGSPVFMLILLIAGKIVLEIKLLKRSKKTVQNVGFAK
ncbi:DUF6498-containing protein [Luteolibacter sp. AS25]|uniref:DUF6498-containing protein n=1 Tax=Luteolibacter sp. AS25 TaxID=3135776 RepID=UPI00398AC72B